MSTIAKFFGKSPFFPLKKHMDKVYDCVKVLPDLLKALFAQDKQRVQDLIKEISNLEHEADLTKNDIRNHLPKSIFLPIQRSSLLEILSLQDCLADKAEDIAIVFSLYNNQDYTIFQDKFTHFFSENIVSVDLVYEIVKEIDELLESSFGGNEAEKVKKMIEALSYKEHQIDLLQQDLLKTLYNVGNELSHVAFQHWISLLKEVGALSNMSEKLANRIRMVIEVK